MGKAAKARKADFRKKEKSKRKAQQAALYESYKKAGTNQKSKRGSVNAKRVRKLVVVKHAALNCGNNACNRCGLGTNTKSFKRVKPYKTSLEKLSYINRKYNQKRAAAKKARQLRNEKYNANLQAG